MLNLSSAQNRGVSINKNYEYVIQVYTYLHANTINIVNM